MLGFHSPSELAEICAAEGEHPDLVEGLVPHQAICLAAGESGVGKSPLLYQMAICVAAGIPFLGRPVRQAPVLYLDGENGARPLLSMMICQSLFLGLPGLPESLKIYSWNLGGARMPDAIPGAIKEYGAGLVIVDPLNAAWPKAEGEAANVQEVFMGLREIMAKQGCSFVLLHHLAKPSEARPRVHLEKVHPRQWFIQARGSVGLVNHSDVRIGFDAALKQGEGDVVMAGFGRISGLIPPERIERCFDGDQPMGYRRWLGISSRKALPPAPQDRKSASAADRMRG